MCVFCGDDGLLSRRAFLRCTASGVGAALATSLPLPALAQVDSATSGSTVTGICDSFVESYIRLNPTLTGRVFGLDRSGVAVTDWSPAGSEAVATLMRDTLGALTSTPAANHKERLGAGFVEDTANSILAGYDAGEQYRKMSTHVFIGPPALLLTSFEMMSQATGGEVPLEPDRITRPGPSDSRTPHPCRSHEPLQRPRHRRDRTHGVRLQGKGELNRPGFTGEFVVH